MAVQIFGYAFPRHVILDGEGKVAYDVLGLSSNTVDQIDAVNRLAVK